jgi:hypothetical protein
MMYVCLRTNSDQCTPNLLPGSEIFPTCSLRMAVCYECGVNFLLLFVWPMVLWSKWWGIDNLVSILDVPDFPWWEVLLYFFLFSVSLLDVPDHPFIKATYSCHYRVQPGKNRVVSTSKCSNLSHKTATLSYGKMDNSQGMAYGEYGGILLRGSLLVFCLATVYSGKFGIHSFRWKRR